MARRHDIGRFATPPDIEDLEALSREGLATIPQALRRVLGNLVIQVEEFPDDDTLEELDCETPFDLLGLYRGIGLPHKTSQDLPEGADLVFLYRRPILDYWCETGEDLADIVRHVLIHEIGHHFGFSDDDMERLEQEAH